LAGHKLIHPRFLFRLALPLPKREPLWTDPALELGDEHRLLPLGELDGARSFAEIRGAWSNQGLTFSVRVEGKTQPLWCRESRPEDSDGWQVWIDTRATHNIHRASRFCHRFVFLPAGAGRGQLQPVAEQLIIPRARQNAPSVRPQLLQVRSQVRNDGYLLEAMLPAEALAGFDPDEHRQLGFTCAVYDRELGLQTFSAGPEYPYEEDPSVWSTLDLVE